MATFLENVRNFGGLSRLQAAYQFGRRRGVSPLTYAAAKRAHLEMLPHSVDPRAGLVLDVGANEGEWTAALLEVFPGDATFPALHEAMAELGFQLRISRPRFASAKVRHCGRTLATALAGVKVTRDD